MPHKSPAQEMGNAAFAVRSPPSAAKTVSSPEEMNAFLRRISSSNCLETGLSSKSFFGIPAVAMMRSRSHTAGPRSAPAGADAACRRDALRHVFGAFVQFSHGRVFAEDDAAVFVDENFKRRALADLHGAAQLFRHHHSPEIIPLCQVGAKKFYKLSEKPLISMALGFPDGATMRLRGFDRLCYFRSKFDRFAPK